MRKSKNNGFVLVPLFLVATLALGSASAQQQSPRPGGTASPRAQLPPRTW